MLVAIAIVGAVGVVVYIAGWISAGVLLPGYDPMTDAISETFALGAGSRWWMTAILVVTGVALAAFGWALDRGLPGTGRAGPVAAFVAGVGTIGAALAPCSPGCPGYGTSLTDTAHVVASGIGYTALVVAPLLVAWRVRDELPRFARWSVILGGVASAGFALRVLGPDVAGGLQQRVFNTVADLWYVLAAAVIVARERTGAPPRTLPAPSPREGITDAGT